MKAFSIAVALATAVQPVALITLHLLPTRPALSARRELFIEGGPECLP